MLSQEYTFKNKEILYKKQKKSLQKIIHFTPQYKRCWLTACLSSFNPMILLFEIICIDLRRTK